jgi:hypothetical protein
MSYESKMLEQFAMPTQAQVEQTLPLRLKIICKRWRFETRCTIQWKKIVEFKSALFPRSEELI